jgi:hypothetical protein
MTNDTALKKKQIDDAGAAYDARMVELKRKRDEIISDFLELLKEKRLEEIRNSLRKV